jgi:hypothetical protein
MLEKKCTRQVLYINGENACQAAVKNWSSVRKCDYVINLGYIKPFCFDVCILM